MQDRLPTYRDWLNNRYNEEPDDDELEAELEDDGMDDEPSRDDGFPLYDRYDEESFP